MIRAPQKPSKVNKAVIALGSNIEPKKSIKKAKRQLSEKFRILAESRWVKTKPIGYIIQPDFINGTILIETYLDVQELNHALKAIEQQLGREESELRFGPRTIDLDIVVFNNKIIDQDFYERQYLKDAILKLLPDLKY